MPADTRGNWANGLGVPVVQTPEDVQALDYLFYVGSAESFDPRAQKIAVAFVKILKHAGVRFGILGARETSTGECVRRAGNEMLFQQLARALVDTLNGLGVTRIVTCDPHAFNTLKNEYPEFGGHYEVVHHTQLIAQLIAEGRVRVDRAFERVIYHEPCYLGRHNGEYEAPRAIIARLTRDAPLEFELKREKSMCCGAGGARMWMEETIGRRINITRVEQALPQRPLRDRHGVPVLRDDDQRRRRRRSGASRKSRRATSPSWSPTRLLRVNKTIVRNPRGCRLSLQQIDHPAGKHRQQDRRQRGR